MGPLELAAIAVTAVATGASIYEGHQAQNFQKKATADARIQNDLAAARQRRDAIRQSRIAAAEVANKGANQGAQLSSSVAGGLGSIATQLNSNLGFLDQWNNLSNDASRNLDKAATAQGWASDFGKVADLSSTVFANAPHIAKVFGH